MTGESLINLQKHWYKILEESGFEDIEKLVNGQMVLKQTAAHSFWDTDEFERAIDEEYFRLISHKVNDEETAYRNEVDGLILKLHADGLKIEEIVRTLRSKGVPFLRRRRKRHRHSIRAIIRKYETSWNIRCYKKKK